MADNRKPAFPSMPLNHWFNLRDKFKKTIPSSITANYLSSLLKMTENSAKANLMPTLKIVGLIGEDNKTNQDKAIMFRDDIKYPSFCQLLLKEIYPAELVEAFSDNSDKDGVVTWFLNHTGLGERAAQKMAAFYLLLLMSELELPKETKSKRAESAPPAKARVKPEKSSGEAPALSSYQPITTSQKFEGLPSLNINLQVHLSSDLSVEQIEQVFASMAKHLYNRQ